MEFFFLMRKKIKIKIIAGMKGSDRNEQFRIDADALVGNFFDLWDQLQFNFLFWILDR